MEKILKIGYDKADPIDDADLDASMTLLNESI